MRHRHSGLAGVENAVTCIGLHLSLRAADGHCETDDLFRVGKGNVGEREAESLEFSGLERLRRARDVHGLHRLLPGVESVATVGVEREARVGPNVREPHRLPLIVEILDLHPHQPDAVTLRGVPEPERSPQPRLDPFHNLYVRNFAGDDAGLYLHRHRCDRVGLVLHRRWRRLRTLDECVQGHTASTRAMRTRPSRASMPRTETAAASEMLSRRPISPGLIPPGSLRQARTAASSSLHHSSTLVATAAPVVAAVPAAALAAGAPGLGDLDLQRPAVHFLT